MDYVTNILQVYEHTTGLEHFDGPGEKPRQTDEKSS